MSRRKRTSLKPKTVITSIMICGTVCMAGIGYLWAKSQVWELSKRKKELEVRRDELRHNNERLEQRYASMCSFTQLDAKVKRLNLGLVMPRPDQIITLTEPFQAAPPALGTEGKMLAAHSEP